MDLNLNTTSTPPQLCPHCGARHDRATEVYNEDVAPSEGDISVCIKCGEASVFEADLSVRKMTDAEFDALSPHAKQIITDSRKVAKAIGPLPEETGHA